MEHFFADDDKFVPPMYVDSSKVFDDPVMGVLPANELEPLEEGAAKNDFEIFDEMPQTSGTEFGDFMSVLSSSSR